MKALVVAAVLLLPLRAAAQDVVVERVDGYVRDEMTRQQIPGIAAAVIRDGHVVLAKGYGLTNVEHQVPVSQKRSSSRRR
jgi:CubicO group peptidase (beta-lactamase class C family)